MSEKDELLSRFTNKYNNHKHKEINNLNNRKKELQLRIQGETEKHNRFIRKKEKLKDENDIADNLVSSLVRIINSRGIIFDIHNKNFKVKEWDHLHIEKVNSLYNFKNKNGDILYILDKRYNDAIKYIISNYSYSIIVMRVDSHSIKVQLRIIE